MASATRRTRPWRSVRRSAALFLVTAALSLTTLPANAAVCLDCEDPELPGPGGGPSCPTIAATVDPSITPAGAYRFGDTVTVNRGTWTNAATYQARLYAGAVALNPLKPMTAATTTFQIPLEAIGKKLKVKVTAYGSDSACAKSEYSTETATAVVKRPAPTLYWSVLITGERPDGITEVGEELRVSGAEASGWEPVPEQVEYTWRRAGVQVQKSAATTYVVTPADLDATLTVTATAKREGYEDGTKTSNATGAVRPGLLAGATATLGAGSTTAVGTPISLTLGDWAPAPADRISITWIRWTTPIPGATSTTYVPTPEDAGWPIHAKVTAVGVPGYQDKIVSSMSTLVTTTEPLRTEVPLRIVGTRRPGSVLSVPSVAWTPLQPIEIRYRWFRDGQAIPGAFLPTYALGVADIGGRVSVQVTPIRLGFPETVTVLDAGVIAPMEAGPWRGPVPKVTGRDRIKAKVKTLSAAKVRARLGLPEAGVGYQWLRNGKAIKGAIRATYKLKKADRRKKLQVRIRVTRPNHEALVVTTAKVKVKGAGRKLR